MNLKNSGDQIKYNIELNPYVLLTYGFIFLVLFDSFYLGTIFKFSFFLIIVSTGLLGFFFQKKNLDNYLIFYFLIIITFLSYSLIVANLRYGFLNYNNFIYVKFLLITFTLVFFNLFKINTIKPFNNILVFFGIITILLFLTSVIFNFEDIRPVFEHKKIIIHQNNNFTFISFSFSPMFIISSSYFLDRINNNKNRFNLLCFLINLLPLFISGERANIFIGTLLLLLLFFILIKKFYFRLLLILILILFSYYLGIFNYFVVTDDNNLKKLNFFYEYKIIFSKLNIILFGQGSGFNNFWITLNYFSPIVEPTYLEMLRFFGFFGSSLLFVLIFYPIFLILDMKSYKFLKKNIFLFTGFFFYLIISVVNPHLLNTHGFLIILILINEILNNEKYN